MPFKDTCFRIYLKTEDFFRTNNFSALKSAVKLILSFFINCNLKKLDACAYYLVSNYNSRHQDKLINRALKTAKEYNDTYIEKPTDHKAIKYSIIVKKSVSKKDMSKYAIRPNKSRYTSEISKWAQQNNTWVIYGCTRKGEDGIYNSALIYNRAGKLIGYYDKLHLNSHDYKYTPGKHLDVYDSDFGCFGVMICADRRWPETVRSLALKGARVIFNPTYGSSSDLNLCMMRTRSMESDIFIAFTHPHQSLITNPKGKVVCNNEDDSQTFTITEIDLNKVDEKRKTSPHLKNRRTDVYKL